MLLQRRGFLKLKYEDFDKNALIKTLKIETTVFRWIMSCAMIRVADSSLASTVGQYTAYRRGSS